MSDIRVIDWGPHMYGLGQIQAVNESSDDDDWDQVFRDAGYEFCRPCGEWHRPPECAINEDGKALDPFTGKPWDAE